MKYLACLGAVSALVLTTSMPVPSDALDLGKSVRKAARGVSKGLSSLGGRDGAGNNGASNNSSSSSGGTSGNGGGLASVGRNGVKAKVGSKLLGGTSVTVGALGKGSVAEASVSAGNAKASAGVLSRGQLAALRVAANPPATGNIPRPGGGAAGVTPDYARRLLASLDRNEKHALELRCRDILRSPKAFDAELITLCRLVAKL